MYKFDHIRSVKDIDNEIARTELRKRYIKDELSFKADTAKNMLKPATIGWQLLRMVMSKNSSGTPAAKLIKIATEIVTTVEATKYGLKLLQKVFR